MAFENVRPFRLDTSGFDNALSGLFGAVKQRNDQAEFDAGTVGLIDTLMPNQNALSQPTMAPMQPQQPAILQAGYGRESGPGAVAGGSVYDRIKKFEGYTPKAQWDYQQHSVGYGTKAKYPGEVIDKPEAERRFKAEVDGARAIVEQVAPNAPPGWKDALTSLTYNSGGKWARSGLGAAIQKGDYQEAARIYAQYNKAGGKTLPGLVNRRQEELGWTQGGNGQPVRTADAGGNQQTAVLEWARRNPRHPTAQAILQKYVTQQMDPNADLDRMKQPQTTAPKYMVVNGRLVRTDDTGVADVTPGTATKPEKQDPLDTFYGKEQARADFKAIGDYRTSADGAGELRGNLDALRKARSETNMEGPIAGLLPALTSAQQSVDSTAENVRLGFIGKTKGAVSDAEMRIFGMATPGRRMRDDAADTIIDGMDLAAQRTQEQAIFFDEWMRSRGSLNGAQAAWQGYTNANPIIKETKPGTYVLNKDNVGNWRQFFSGQRGQQPQQQPMANSPQQGPAAPKTPQEYQALPSGTPYMAPDGSMRVKP